MSPVKNLAFLIIVLPGLSATSLVLAAPALAAPEGDAGQLAIPTPVADNPAAGQRAPSATELPNSELPELPDLPDLPDATTPEGPAAGQAASQNGSAANRSSEPIARGVTGPGVADALEPIAEGEEYSIFDLEPALLESSGSWLRRGFWYTEVDAVILNREINKHTHIPLMHQTTFASQSPLTGRIRGVNNLLAISGSKPDVETMPRIKLGRFLFRDSQNRDHTAEFTWFGGGQWAQQGAITSSASALGPLTVPSALGGANASFSGANSSEFDYASRFNSFELNYHLKRRLHRDQMIMQPDGEWVRAATPTWTRTFLAGLRYFELDENLAWDALGVPDLINGGTVDGHYRVRTENDLFGMQTGASLSYETARWSFGVLGKTGIYLDQMFLDSSFNNTNRLTSGGTNSHNDAVSFLSEVRLQGKWHLRTNFSFRAGAELLYVKSVALAPYQVNFIPGDYPTISTTLGTTSNAEQYSFYMGFSAGFEGYW